MVEMRLCLLPLVLLLIPPLNGCSFMHGYWIEAEYELSQCPPNNFEMPERALGGSGLIVGEDTEQYCHGFSFYEAIWVPPGADYFNVTETSGLPIKLYARFKRESKCKLQVLVSAKCGFNRVESACRQETFPRVTEATIRDSVETAVDGLLFRSGAKIKKLSNLQVIGFADDLKAWCQNRSAAVQHVGKP